MGFFLFTDLVDPQYVMGDVVIDVLTLFVLPLVCQLFLHLFLTVCKFLSCGVHLLRNANEGIDFGLISLGEIYLVLVEKK